MKIHTATLFQYPQRRKIKSYYGKPKKNAELLSVIKNCNVLTRIKELFRSIFHQNLLTPRGAASILVLHHSRRSSHPVSEVHPAHILLKLHQNLFAQWQRSFGTVLLYKYAQSCKAPQWLFLCLLDVCARTPQEFKQRQTLLCFKWCLLETGTLI